MTENRLQAISWTSDNPLSQWDTGRQTFVTFKSKYKMFDDKIAFQYVVWKTLVIYVPASLCLSTIAMMARTNI